ncbi:glycosyl transferase [Tritrichomonas foetus]|uniref:UDP-N-acetylglucosamine--dolichyl-phosphate N-acetylglucosaminephosphotransferase n=1 Tax=Tritrichomonas foetus TaxID=1144522 RepID=A0A1J4KYB8_9EUKA|nr:glycosyl transferase [Tritrichomonas foetus]|eukprot:OHT16249.1 glycosyl transferase [Tritrichomonas foetus]
MSIENLKESRYRPPNLLSIFVMSSEAKSKPVATPALTFKTSTFGNIFYWSLILLTAPSWASAITYQTYDYHLLVTLIIGIIAFFLSVFAIPRCRNTHIRSRLFGRDLNKGEDPETAVQVPETMGLESSAIMIACVIIIAAFSEVRNILYPAIISISLTTFLGFADDVLNIPWRVKIFIPFFSVLPLVLNYDGSTTIYFHGFLSPIKSLFNVEYIDVGIFYYLYIFCLFVFCTHSINIYAGINGLEAGQSLIVACFLLFHSICYWGSEPGSKAAAILLIPFIATTYGLLYFNWFPSRVFVGDTFTLTAGAVIASAGVLGHFAEMTLLFMLPQLINFAVSLPQLIGFIPCPRHRLPVLNKKTGKLEGKTINWNLVNLWLLIFGPKTEERLCIELLIFQIICCLAAFGVRYLYNTDIFGV